MARNGAFFFYVNTIVRRTICHDGFRLFSKLKVVTNRLPDNGKGFAKMTKTSEFLPTRMVKSYKTSIIKAFCLKMCYFLYLHAIVRQSICHDQYIGIGCTPPIYWVGIQNPIPEYRTASTNSSSSSSSSSSGSGTSSTNKYTPTHTCLYAYGNARTHSRANLLLLILLLLLLLQVARGAVNAH